MEGCPGQIRTIHLHTGEFSCGNGTRLDLAIAYLRHHRLAFEETVTVRHEPTGTPPIHGDSQ